MTDLIPLAVAERRDLADLLQTLTPEQWAAPSLCTGWTVRDVVAHLLSFEELSWHGLVATFTLGPLRRGSINDQRLAAYADHSPTDLLQLLHRSLEPRGLTRGFGGGIALTDGLIHHQDVRRALDLPRMIPPERLLPVLDFALKAPTLPTRKLARGLNLHADDLEWNRGDGPLVTGNGEAVLMAITGRSQALADVTGPGVALLSERIAA